MNYMYLQILYLIPLVLIITYFVMAYGRKVFLSKTYMYRHGLTRFVIENYKKKRDVEWLINYIAVSIVIVLILLSATIPYLTTRQYVLVHQQAETKLSVKRRIPIVIAVDYSASMMGEKKDTALRAVREYIEHVGEYVLIGLIPFCNFLISPISLTSNRTLLENALWDLERLEPFGSTIYSRPLKQALEWLVPYAVFNITPFVIFVTDGLPTEHDIPVYREIVYEYVKYGIPIYSILINLPGEEEDYAITVLSEIADLTSGKLYTVEKISDLLKYFREITELTIGEVSKYVFETTIEYPFETRLYLVHEYIVLVLLAFSIYSLTRTLVYKISL